MIASAAAVLHAAVRAPALLGVGAQGAVRAGVPAETGARRRRRGQGSATASVPPLADGVPLVAGQTSLSLVLQTEDVVWLLGDCVCRHCARAVRLGVRPRRPTGVARSSSRRARVRRCTPCSVTPTAQPSMPAAKATSVCTTSTSALSLAQVGMTGFWLLWGSTR